jgi:DNA polymerase-3 subunit gamma/tau
MAQTQSWYKKYRPRVFAEYAGGFADAALKRFSDTDRLPQVTLLHGVYGCGKTTAARLLAGYYLCENPNESGQPCGICPGCLQVCDLIVDGEDDAASESVVEINAASINRVEDIRKLISESMLTLPVISRYKVFILDECHRITPEAQNALLKVLEDVPSHLAIIFATTEPEKLLPTLVSRCQVTIEVRRQTQQSMADILLRVARGEGLAVERRALQIIAKKGGRIPRDCINLMEAAAAAYDKQITAKNVLEYTGEADTSQYFGFIEASRKGLTDILTFIGEFSQGDVSYHKFLSGLARFVLDAVYVRMGISIEDFDAGYLKAVKRLFASYKVNEFHKLLRLVDDAARRTPAEIGTAELALSVLALSIGDITAVSDGISAETVKALAAQESGEGARKFVERETELLIPRTQDEMVGLDEFLSSIGAVAYG